MASNQVGSWWMGLRRLSRQRGALANARTAIERDRRAAVQRAEADAAFEVLRAEQEDAEALSAGTTRAS